jgi:hypothetical protein
MSSTEYENEAGLLYFGRPSPYRIGSKGRSPDFRSYGATDISARNPEPGLDDVDSSIPPADHGIAAWLFLAGCFLLEGLVWGKQHSFRIHRCCASASLEVIANASVSGLPYSYGVFQKFYSEYEPFSSQRGIAAIGTSGLVGVAPYLLLR